jgi:hypothetical protein
VYLSDFKVRSKQIRSNCEVVSLWSARNSVPKATAGEARTSQQSQIMHTLNRTSDVGGGRWMSCRPATSISMTSECSFNLRRFCSTRCEVRVGMCTSVKGSLWQLIFIDLHPKKKRKEKVASELCKGIKYSPVSREEGSGAVRCRKTGSALWAQEELFLTWKKAADPPHWHGFWR